MFCRAVRGEKSEIIDGREASAVGGAGGGDLSFGPFGPGQARQGHAGAVCQVRRGYGNGAGEKMKSAQDRGAEQNILSRNS